MDWGWIQSLIEIVVSLVGCIAAMSSRTVWAMLAEVVSMRKLLLRRMPTVIMAKAPSMAVPSTIIAIRSSIRVNPRSPVFPRTRCILLIICATYIQVELEFNRQLLIRPDGVTVTATHARVTLLCMNHSKAVGTAALHTH